jgi:hypothetical protein
MRITRYILALGLCTLLGGCDLWCGLTGSCRDDWGTKLNEETLPIAPVTQATAVWCWLATGEMIHRYFNSPNVNPAGNYQCGMVGILYPFQCSASCLNCVVSASSFAVVNDMIVRYPLEVRRLANMPATLLQTRVEDRSLSFDEVKSEIDGGRPILVALNPSGFRVSNQISEHVALIVGYGEYEKANTLIVNDPWPYEVGIFQGTPDPYQSAHGIELLNNQYEIEFDRFTSRLAWGQTIYNIRPRSLLFAFDSPYLHRVTETR